MSELKDGYAHKVHQILRKKEAVWPPNASWNVAVVVPIRSKRLVLNPKVYLQLMSSPGK